MRQRPERNAWAQLAAAVLAHPWAFALGLVLVCVGALAGAAQLRIDFSSASFYGGEGPAIERLTELHARFGPDDATLAVLAEAHDGDMLEPARLAELHDLAEELRVLPQVASVRSIADVVPPARLGSPVARALVLDDERAVPLLVSADGRRAVVAVELRRSSDDLGAVVPVVGAVEAAIERHAGRADTSWSLAGVPALRAAFFSRTIADQQRLVPASLLLIGVGLWLAFRSRHGVVVPAAAAVVPSILLAGTMGALGEPIGLLNQAYFTLIPVLAVADAVHLVSAFDREARLRAGDGPLAPAARREAIVAACGRLGGACLATSATTVLGFLSLTTSDLPALRQFGAFAAFGMAAAFATVVVVVPLLLAVTRASPGPPPGTRGLERLAALTLARRPVILLGFALLAAGAATAATRVRIDNRLSDLLDADHPVRIASETLDRELSGSLSLELQLVGSPGTFAHRASAPELAALERELQRELSARVVIGPGRFGDELLSADRSRARLSIRVAEPGGRAFEELAGRARAQVEPFARARGLEVEVGGTALLAYQGVNAIARDLRTSLLGMFVVVAIAVVWAARRVGHGLWAVLPNALPLLVGYATLGLLGIDLDPLAAVVLILALGIAVDDTIHLLAAMRAHPGARTDPAAAITSALVGSGRPIIVTSLVVSGGLAVDLLGSFPPLRLLGLLGAVVMLCALVCDLVLLPALVARR